MNLPTTTTATESPLALLLDPARFEHLQRVGAMIAMSPLFPEHLRGKGDMKQATANAVLVLNMANRLREDPLTVAQNIYFVSGRPGWNTSYMISKANMHGVFKGPIDWEVTGEGADLSVTAFGILSGTGKRVQATCSMAMAKAEGWTKNTKYQTMPEQMLRYRSAAFLIRLYCPEVMVGIPAGVEVESPSMRDVTPAETEAGNPVSEERAAPAEKPVPKPRAAATTSKPTPPVEEAEVTEAEPEPTNEPNAEPEGQAYDFKAVYNGVMSDLLDSGSVSGVKGHWGERGLDAMESGAPDLFAKLQSEFASYE